MCTDPGCRPENVTDFELRLRKLAEHGVPSSPSEDRLLAIARLGLRIAREAARQLPFHQRPF